MNTVLNSLKVLRGLKDNKLFFTLAEYADCKDEIRAQKFNDLLYEIYLSQAENNLGEYVSELILTDENAFSVICAKGETPSAFLAEAYCDDVRIIKSAISQIDDGGKFNCGNLDEIFESNSKQVISNLQVFYRKNGYGIFIRNKAFTFKNDKFIPQTNSAEITLDQLKGYSYEKKLIIDNINDFLSGLPYSHMLLYGDRGTGKSSTIHAILNKYFGDKLRLIEVNKREITLIPIIKSKLYDNPLKFIIFLDDLSLDEQSDDVSTFKTIFEGTFANSFGNVMLVATSNRRHIVKENHTDRQNSVHPSDIMDEQLSLSDRFGLTVMFSTTDKQAYLSIIDQLADGLSLKTSRETLHTLAERWALQRGGRSPRHAKQFLNLVAACEKSDRNIEF